MVGIIAVPTLLVKVTLFAPSVEPVGISADVQDVPLKFGVVMAKSAAVPELLAMIANLDPVASLTTEAVTPRLAPELVLAELMALARSVRLSPTAELPVPILTGLTPPGVIVKVPVVSVAVALDSRSEYHDPVVAGLVTTTVWTPATVPVAAVAVSSVLLEEVTVRAARGPVRVLSDCMSFARA